MLTSPTVLLVEDDFLIRSCLTEYLEDSNVTVLEAESCSRARAFIMSDQHFDVVIMDISLPDGSGADIGVESRRQRPDVPIIYATGHGASFQSPNAGDRVVSKPYHLDTVLSLIQELRLTA